MRSALVLKENFSSLRLCSSGGYTLTRAQRMEEGKRKGLSRSHAYRGHRESSRMQALALCLPKSSLYSSTSNWLKEEWLVFKLVYFYMDMKLIMG